MKLIFTITALMLLAVQSYAQSGNPYEQFGYEGRVLKTAEEESGKQFIEIYNSNANEKIQKIVLDWKGKKYFCLDKDGNVITGDSLPQELALRFLSVDPLTKDYPMLTPYQFASNRSIDGDDIDGKEWGQKVVPQNNGQTKIERWIYIKVINNTNMSNTQLLGMLNTQAKSVISETYSSGDTKQINYDLPESNIQFVVANPDANINNDFIVEFNNSDIRYTDRQGDPLHNKMHIGISDENGKKRAVFNIALSIAHELGHTLGLLDIGQDNAGAASKGGNNNGGLGPDRSLRQLSLVNDYLINNEKNKNVMEGTGTPRLGPVVIPVQQEDATTVIDNATKKKANN